MAFRGLHHGGIGYPYLIPGIVLFIAAIVLHLRYRRV
jgi:hypothetical protein